MMVPIPQSSMTVVLENVLAGNTIKLIVEWDMQDEAPTFIVPSGFIKVGPEKPRGTAASESRDRRRCQLDRWFRAEPHAHACGSQFHARLRMVAYGRGEQTKSENRFRDSPLGRTGLDRLGCNSEAHTLHSENGDIRGGLYQDCQA